MPLERLLLTDAGALDALAPEWEGLLADSASNEVTLSPGWLLPWWRVFGPRDGRPLRALTFRAGGRLVGLGPLLRRRRWHRRLVPFRRLEPLGSGEPDADSVCSDYLNVVARRGHQEAVAAAFASALADGAAGPWDELVVPRMALDTPMPHLLHKALRGAGLLAELTQTGSAPFVPLPLTWEAYLAELPKKYRYLARKAERDFDAWAAGADRLERAATLDDADRLKHALIDLHQQRWAGAGAFRSPHFRAFHDGVIRTLLPEGGVELAVLSVRGRPVAAAYSLIRAGKVSYYQTGRALDVPAGVQPGLALLARLIRGHIEAGRRELDFLAGPATYKRQWAPAGRPLVELRAARRGWREALRRAVEWGVGKARVIRDALFRRCPAPPPREETAKE
jgi:CelD/BcsL family acetyltransferase involved in cellulose biosynthesis